MKIYQLATTALFYLLSLSITYATPKQIIIIRHADKLEQRETGPVLSAKGQVRAIKFAFYFLDQFGEPDFLIAANPVDAEGKNGSIRHIQTLSPLANILEEKNPKHYIPILHPYGSSEYAKLAKYILDNKQFDHKVLIICWSHGRIPSLAEKLGVKQTLPEWKDTDYDSVYVLNYDSNGNIQEFKILNHQYPVAFNGNWVDLFYMITLT